MTEIATLLLPPTARLTLLVLRDATEPLSLAEICDRTGASLHATLRTTQALTKRGLIVRSRRGIRSFFCLTLPGGAN